MTTLQLLSCVVGSYLIMEAISASAEMNEGDSLFCIVKYLFVGYVGASLIFYVQTWDKLIYASALVVFLLPKLHERINHWRNKALGVDVQKRRMADK